MEWNYTQFSTDNSSNCAQKAVRPTVLRDIIFENLHDGPLL